MLKSLHLQDVGPVSPLDAEFAERINIVTGDNGLGKSFLLELAFLALAKRTPIPRVFTQNLPFSSGNPHLIAKLSTDEDAHEHKFFLQHTPIWLGSPQPHQNALAIYAGAEGAYAVADFLRMRKSAPGWDGPEEPHLVQFDNSQLIDGFTRDGKVVSNGLIRDWVSWYFQSRPSDNGPSPLRMLNRAIHRLSPPNEPLEISEPQRLSTEDARDFPTLKTLAGVVPFPQLSAGIRRITCLAYVLVWAWREHPTAAKLLGTTATGEAVLIIDEVESHLHPKWQRTILPAILDVVKELEPSLKTQIIATTHSPLVLASLEPIFDEEKDALFHFAEREGKVVFEKSEWVAYGDASSWLESEIFELKHARSREAEIAIEAANAFMRNDFAALPQDLQTREQIHQRLVETLSGLDAFWPQWIVRNRK